MVPLKMNATAGRICFLGSIAHILKTYNIFLTEEHLLGFSTALQFRFGYTSSTHMKERLPSITCADFSIDIDRINEVLRLFNLKIECSTNQNRAEYAETVKELLKSRIPIMILTDVFNLPYDYEEKKHEARFITCYAWQESEKKIEIVDTAYNILHKCCFHDMIGEDLIFTNDMSNLMTGDVFTVWHIEHINAEVGENGLNAAKLSIKIPPMAHLESYEVHFGCIVSQYKTGYLGIRYLKEELQRYNACLDTVNTDDNFIQTVFKQLNSYTGPTVTRKMFHQFLTMFSPGERYESLLSYAAVLHNNWENIGFLLMKSLYKANSRLLAKACEQLDHVMETEMAMQSLIIKSRPASMCIATD